ncbi:MAG: class I SAM-dependent methyltransferase [Actinomycetota bacterium]|nr:class I SAM-dependent methyltransferase [Actinomycetota bacterium]
MISDSPLATAANAAGCAAVGDADLTQVGDDVVQLDNVVLLGLAAELGKVTCTHSDGWSAATVGDQLGVADRHRWIVERWLVDLSAAGLVQVAEVDSDVAANDIATSASTGITYRALHPPSRSELVATRRRMEQARCRLGYRPELAELLLRSLHLVPRLLADEVDVQAVLYPGGDPTTAEAVYGDNATSRYLNAAAAEVTSATVGASSRPLRALEVGAGIGATTQALLPAAGPAEFYLYTDLSPFFLDAARRRFAEHSGPAGPLRYGIIDICGDLAAQLHRVFAGSVRQPATGLDLIVAATMAHNATHVGRFLGQLRQLLAPGGRLVLIESVVERSQSLTLMPFALSSRTGTELPPRFDERAGTHRTYLSDVEWHRHLAAAGLHLEVDLPGLDHPLRSTSQRLLVATRPRPQPPEEYHVEPAC